MKKSEMEKIYNYFKTKNVVRKDVLEDFIEDNFPERKKKYINFYLFDLKTSEYAYVLNKNMIKISKRIPFKAKIDETVKELNKSVISIIEDVGYCIWQKTDIQNLMRHQFFENTTYLSVEKSYLENVFLGLKLNNFNIGLASNHMYTELNSNPIIIENLINKAPLNRTRKSKSMGNNKNYNNNEKIPSPKIEKLLIDFFVDKKGIYGIDSGELEEIFRNSLTLYQINIQTLFSYANKRSCKEKLIEYLTNTIRFDYITGDFIND